MFFVSQVVQPGLMAEVFTLPKILVIHVIRPVVVVVLVLVLVV